jgi:hypothetical protein
MTRGLIQLLGAIAGGLVPLALFFSAGCDESVDSRARTAEFAAASAADADVKGAVSPDGTSRSGDEPDGSSAPRPNPDKVQAKEARTTARASAGGRKSTREITFDTLKFEIEKGAAFERTMLTPGIEKLAGERVRIRGYMLPSFQQSGIKQFVLVRDNMECCFGPGAALYDCIIVEMANDQTAEFSVRPIAVEGTFNVREFKGPDDRHLAIFHLDGERVR